MKNLILFKHETSTGLLEFTGTPVSNDFDFRGFAKENGFNNTVTFSPENTKKYGGVGFVVYNNAPAKYYELKTLEVLFIDGLPVMYRTIEA